MKKNTLFTKTFLTLGFLLISLLGIAQTQTITTPGASTFTVPAGVTSITVEVWGGGGRGGARGSSAGASGGGGGGAYARTESIAVTPGSTLNLNVGNGSTTSAAGGDSWFINNTTLLAKGGNSVDLNTNTGALGGSSAFSIGSFVFAGGDGSNGVTGTGGGGGGSSAGTALIGTTVTNTTVGAIAPSGGGNGGNGKTGGGGAGSPGGLGAGGGGAYTTGNGNQGGGPGGNGKVIVTWTVPASYCSPTFAGGAEPITNVTFAGINNTTSATTGGPSIQIFTDIATVIQGSVTNTITIKGNTVGNYTDYFKVYVDWDQNGTLGNNANEIYDIGTLTNSTGTDAKSVSGNISVPATAILGNTKIRIMKRWDSYSSGPCQNDSGYGEAEDYVVNVIASTPPTITSLGTTSGCVSGLITINGANLSGATASNVTIGGTAVTSITSNNGSILIAVIGSGTTGNVSVTTGGGTATSASTFTVTSVPIQPSVITGNATPCAGTSQSYSVTNVPGTTYTWTFPSGWTQTSGGTTHSIIVTTNGTSGNISVTPSNSCGNGTARTLASTPSNVPAQPSSISGSSTPCSSSSQSYSVTNVSGTTYNWTFPSGWIQTGGGTTNSVTVTTNGTSGTISVTPSNTCGIGTAQTLAITISSIPTQPSTITGNTDLCSGSSQTYSVTNVPGTTYTWAFPSGWSQTSGGTTNSVTFTVGTNSGNISVTPSNGCANGTARTLSTTVTASPTITGTTPGSRTGAGTVSLSATASAGTISWYGSLTGGSALGTGANFTTPGIIITTTYYVETNNGSCSSTPRVAVVATVNYPEITVLSNGNIIMDEDTTPITTDYTNLGTTGIGVGITRTYTIQNSGTVNLTIGTINIAGLHASEFVVTAVPATSVAPAASTTFSIRFTPTALGTRNANVWFVTNDPDENPFNYDITGVGGTGLIPEVNVTGNGVTIIDGDSGAESADHSNFGSVTIPGTVVRTFTIQNTGTGPLLLTGFPMVVITGSSDFTVTTQPSSNTIAAGANLTFQVTYNPTLTGNSVAIISINNDDYDENVYDFAIIGTAGISGKEIDIQGNDVSIVDGDTTPSASDQTDFGITDAVTPIALTYNVFSFGSNSLAITKTIAITGPDAAMFSATELPTSLGVGGVTSFVITFTPSAVLGVKTATITITSDDSDEGTYSFDIKAEVQSLAALTVAPGGITSNLKFWIKADSNIGTTSDNTDITSWQDQTYGGTKNAVSKFSKEPKFQNNPNYNVNFNPVIHFNGSNTMTGGQGFNNIDMYIVVKPTNAVTYTSSPMDVYCGDDVTVSKMSQDVTGFEMGNTSSRHSQELIAYNQAANTAFGVAEISTTKFYSGPNIFNPRKNATYPTVKMDILHNGNTLTTSSVATGTYKDIINSRYWLGRSEFWDSSYDGDILEIINYDTRNSDADKRKIETYLAIKYGITLGLNGTSLDYVNSAGSIIYEAGAGFNYNIAGIGRDDKSQLNQKQSKSENTNSDITIGLKNIYDTNSNNTNAFDVDKKFLVWGHNNNTLDAQVPISVDMSTGITSGGPLSTMVDFISIARTWRVRETGGDVPLVKVSIPSSILTATITPPGDFLMFISDSPVFNPTAEYRIMRMNGSNLEAEFDFSGTKYVTFGYAPERTYTRCISFDGVNDYLDAGNVLNLDNSFTVSSWIKRNSTNQTIFSKRDNAFTTGYDLSINSAGRAEMSWMNGAKQTITSSVVIPSGIWHNIAVSYDGTTAKLYIDGVLDVTKAMNTVPANTQSFLIAAADGVNTTSFFNGGIDEVRVWKVALTDKQLRYVMNQEISRDATLTGGTTIPNSITLNDIKVIPWANLSAYYPMSTYTFTNAKDISNNNFTAALKNLTTVDSQTAPLPYETANDGPWQTPSTWLNNTVQDLPYGVSLIEGTIDWNIVRTSHNVTSTGNKTVLGLMVNSQTLTASSDTKIEVTNYLKLDGKIDLVGMSQLVQTLDCDLDVTSSGSIERDQKGQANKFNYNYWCSPVSAVNIAANNTNFTLTATMKDGFNATPRDISWIAGYNGIAGDAITPMSIARYWLYTFDNKANAYANWNKITETTPIRVGQGFTMKGSGSTGTQNYTFVGKPNNGLINSNTVSSDQLLLTGNPYPSALDADAFINANLGAVDQGIDGTLYFWEHYTSNTTHVLKDYQGGYAVKNLVGGVAPVSSGVDFINQTATSTRGIPNRYIPVGQGFFVNGKVGSVGTIIFNNNQRAFFKEDDATNSNIVYKKSSRASKVATVDHWNNNSNDIPKADTFKRIRLGFNSNDNYHRQVLLGFMNERATSDMDYGYDGISLDELPNDMYFLNHENQLVIQGDGYFNEEASYPIGIKTNLEGKVSLTIDALENFDAQQKVYIYDEETKKYNEIQKNAFEVNLPAGVHNTRFSLRFKDKSLSTEKTLSTEENNAKSNEIELAHIQNSNILKITNNSTERIVEKVTLFNITGQSIATWKIENQDQQNIQIPIKTVSSGVYIAKLNTTTGEVSKKLIIK